MALGIFGILEIGKESLFNQQSSIGVTAHNIANVNTEGYSRQRPIIETMDPQVIGGLYFGRGSTLEAITKSYDRFLNKSILIESSVLGKWESQETYMAQAETVMNESNQVGLNDQLSKFWNAWEELANSPESIPQRTVLQNAGKNIAMYIKNMSSNLEQVRASANEKIAGTVYSVNQLSADIAALNEQILGTETQQANANDLTDRRDLKIEQLGKLIDINVLYERDNQATVQTGSGKLLVAENLSWELAFEADSRFGNYYAVKHVDNGAYTDITDEIRGGSLKGLLEVREEYVSKYMDALDLLAASLVTEVNRIHYGGYGFDGSTQNYFFDPIMPLLEEDPSNRGGAQIYDARMIDPTAFAASDYRVCFVNSSPGETSYEIVDDRNDEYLFCMDSGNNTLVLNDTAGGAGDDTIIALARGTYTGEQLAAQLEESLNGAASEGQSYTVSYNSKTRVFSIANRGSESLKIKWDDDNTRAGRILGFDGTSTITANTSESSALRSGTYAYSDYLFEIDATNNTINFDDGSGVAQDITLASGVYTGEEVAQEVQQQLNGAGGAGFDVSVDFVRNTRKFNVTLNGSAGGGIDFNWSASTAAASLGFEATDTTGLSVGDRDASDNESGEYRMLQRIFTISSMNNTIVFEDGGVGDGTGGASVTIQLDDGIYTGSDLAAQIENLMESAEGSSGQDYIVTYDDKTGAFTILNGPENLHDVQIDWTDSSAATTLGFSAGAVTLEPYSGAVSFDASDEIAGDVASYDQLYFYGMSVKLADQDLPPVRDDVLWIYGIKNAALNIGMNSETLTNPEKIAAANNMFDVDGSNNTIVFDDDGTLGDGLSYKVVLESGRYSPDALAAEIEQQLEKNGSGVYIIEPGVNDAIVFNDEDTAADFTATIAAGTYTGSQLASAVEQALEDESLAQHGAGSGRTFSVLYDGVSQKITITNDADNPNELDLKWSNAGSTAAGTLGFEAQDTSDIVAGGTDTSDLRTATINQSYAVRYNEITGNFTITGNPSNPAPLMLLWENAETTADLLLGFRDEIYEITANENDAIEFHEGSQPPASDVLLRVRPGIYAGNALAEEVQTQLNDAATQAYTVTYNEASREFTITSDAENTDDLTLHWSSYAGSQDLAETLGFDPALGDVSIASGASATSDESAGGVTSLSPAQSDFATGLPGVGDNRNALDLAGLKDMAVMDRNTLSIDAYYSIMQSDVGTDVDAVNRGIENQKFMVDQYETRRQAVAGVSLDEEMVNLIKYQQAFAASAKLVSALDNMMDTVINL